MKYLSKYCTMLAAIALMAVTFACSDEDDPAPVKVESSITLTPDNVTIGSTGGRGYVVYTLENAPEDATIEVTTDAAWVKDIDTAVEGRIAFTVEPNTLKEAREAEVTVKCGTGDEALTGKFTVKQDAADEFFTISDPQSTESTLSVNVSPTDKEMPYLVMILPKSQADMYQSDDEMHKDDMSYIDTTAGKLGTSFETLLSRYSRTGDVDLLWESLAPNTAYCIYAYGVSPKGERLTPISKAYVSTAEIVQVPMTFDIFYDINGSVVTMTVVPSDDNALYYYNILDAGTSDEEILEIVQNNLNLLYNQFIQYGYSLEQAVEATVFRGVQSNTFERALKPDTDYVGFAMAVSQSGVASAQITRKDLHTGKTQQSELTLDIEVSDIRTRTAQLTCVPSDPAEKYVINYGLKSDYGHLSDQKVLDALAQFVRMGQLQAGNGSLNARITGLKPETEYQILACGMNGSSPTTKLFRVDFATNEDGYADVTLEITYGKYFSAGDAAERWPGQIFDVYPQDAILPVSVKSNGDRFYYKLYSGDLTNPNEVTDEDIISVLTGEGYSDPEKFFIAPFGAKQTLLAVAEDEHGYYGDVFRECFTLDRSGVSPIEEFDYTPTGYVNAKRARSLVAGKLQLKPASGRATLLPKSPASLPAVTTPLQRIDEMQPWRLVKDIMSRRLPVEK